MTVDHPRVTPSHLHNRHNYRHLTNDPVYRSSKIFPWVNGQYHDYPSNIFCEWSWSALCSIYKPNEQSKDIQLIPWPWIINDLNLKITVHSTDTIRIDVGCSYCPVAVDIDGVVRLSTALTITRETDITYN